MLQKRYIDLIFNKKKKNNENKINKKYQAINVKTIVHCRLDVRTDSN